MQSSPSLSAESRAAPAASSSSTPYLPRRTGCERRCLLCASKRILATAASADNNLALMALEMSTRSLTRTPIAARTRSNVAGPSPTELVLLTIGSPSITSGREHETWRMVSVRHAHLTPWANFDPRLADDRVASKLSEGEG